MIRNGILSLVLCFSVGVLHAQNGSLRLTNDSTMVGYLKRYRTGNNNEGIEFWETKRDKDPQRFAITEISMYTLGKDTYKVLQGYQPFSKEDGYIDLVQAVQLDRGKVNLYAIPNPAYVEQQQKQIGMSASFGAIGGAVGAVIFRAVSKEHPVIYILEDKSGYLKAMPAAHEDLHESLKDFFPERYVTRYAEEKGAIKYKDVTALVKLYNSK